MQMSWQRTKIRAETHMHTHKHTERLTNGLCSTQAFGCHMQIVNLVKWQALSASWQVNAGGIRRVTETGE